MLIIWHSNRGHYPFYFQPFPGDFLCKELFRIIYGILHSHHNQWLILNFNRGWTLSYPSIHMSSRKFKELKLLLKALPTNPPISNQESCLNWLLGFTLDEDKVEDIGDVLLADPMDDPLKWLDDGLPDLSGFANWHFDLAMQFDIAHYVQILADSVSDSELERRTDAHCKPQDRSLKNVQASALAPEDSKWATW